MGSDPRQSTRVLQVVRPAVGGMRAHVLQLAVGLRAFGFESELACPGDSELVHDAMAAGVQVHPVAIVGPLRPLRDLLAVISLAEVIRERRPALIHAHGSKAALIARAATIFGGKTPTVVTVHNQVLYGPVSGAMRRVYITMERWLARRTARIVTVSEALRRELLTVYGLPESLVVTIHNGLDLSPFMDPGDRGAARARYGVPGDAVVIGLAARSRRRRDSTSLWMRSSPCSRRIPVCGSSSLGTDRCSSRSRPRPGRWSCATGWSSRASRPTCRGF